MTEFIVFPFQLKNCQSDASISALLDSNDYAFRFDIGIGQSSRSVTMDNIDHVLQLFAKHYLLLSVKSELDQLVEGLGVLKMLDLIRDNPNKFMQLFVHSVPQPLTTDHMLELFPPKYSPPGSNCREVEEAVIMLWIHFLQNIECKILPACTVPWLCIIYCVSVMTLTINPIFSARYAQRLSHCLDHHMISDLSMITYTSISTSFLQVLFLRI